MNRVVRGFTGSHLRPPDHRWVSALLAEAAAIESKRERLGWLIGSSGMLLGHLARSTLSLATPAASVLFAATLFFAAMAVIEYEGLVLEDDWYPLFTAVFAAALLGTALLQFRSRLHPHRP